MVQRKVILPWQGRRFNQFRRRPELGQQQRFLELLERNIRIFSQRALQQRLKLCQPRLEGPGDRFRLGMSCGNLMLARGLPVLPGLLTRASGGILGILLGPRLHGLHRHKAPIRCRNSGHLAKGVNSAPQRAECGRCGRRPGRCQVRAQPERLSRVLHTVGMIRLGTSADLAAATGVYRRASLSNAGDRDKLLAHQEYLILGPEGLAEGRTHVAEEDGSLVGFATWIEAAGIIELEDLFVDPGYMRRGIAAALINRIVEVLRARGVERLEVTANPHALGFYRAVGFIDCGVAETEFGAAPRMELAIS